MFLNSKYIVTARRTTSNHEYKPYRVELVDVNNNTHYKLFTDKDVADSYVVTAFKSVTGIIRVEDS